MSVNQFRPHPRKQRLPYGDNNPALSVLRKPRTLAYRVMTKKGKAVDDLFFATAGEAIAWGRSLKIKKFWWVGTEFGDTIEEPVYPDPADILLTTDGNS